MTFFIRLCLTLGLALIIGLGLTSRALNGKPPLGLIAIGPWQTMPNAGVIQPDPYVRAVQTRHNLLPLAVNDGLMFTAEADSDGKAFDGRCVVSVEGLVAPARLWSLAVTDLEGHPIDNPAGRTGFNSQNIDRMQDGLMSLQVAAHPQSGNWLPTGGIRHFRLVLRVYDTPAALSLGQKGALTLPTIRQLPC